MTTIPFFQVDAFVAGRPLTGNPAAVMPLDHWLGELERSGYAGYVGLEYKPTSTTVESLAWLPVERR